jgi:hypothetical protein
MNPQRARCNSSTMNAIAIVRAPHAVTQPPVLHATPERAALDASRRSASQRLPVWEERARKMGFPPSAR